MPEPLHFLPIANVGELKEHSYGEEGCHEHSEDFVQHGILGRLGCADAFKPQDPEENIVSNDMNDPCDSPLGSRSAKYGKTIYVCPNIRMCR